jgi:hypothetical protein
MAPTSVRRRFGPVGRCIYCGATRYSMDRAKLGKEHIIPEGIGGNLELLEASCFRCEKIINKSERVFQTKMFDPIRYQLGMPAPASDRQSDRRDVRYRSTAGCRVENADPGADHSAFGTPEWVMAAGWLASDSVPPRLTASLNIWRALRNGEGRRLSALDVEREGRARAGALLGRRRAWRANRVEERQIVHLARPWDGRGEFGDDAGRWRWPFPSAAQRLQRAAQHPAGMRIELRADGAAQRLDRLHHRLGAQRRAGDQVGMAADIFGQRVDRDIGAMLDRALEDRPEQGVVADDDGREALRVPISSAIFRGSACDVDQRVGRIGRRLDHDDRDAALAHRRLGGRLCGRRPRRRHRKADGADAEAREGPGSSVSVPP